MQFALSYTTVRSFFHNAGSLIVASLLPFSAAASPEGLMSLRTLDIPHPYCEGKVSLGVASEYFVEIANDLPGVSAYNDMIVTFHRHDWETLDKQFAAFRRAYETSPLLEAASYLMAESLFERIGRDEEGKEIAAAEKGMREVQLAYPASTLAPVLTASAGSFFLDRQKYSKALALYESARLRYSHHALACVFLSGIGESNFRMRDWTAARKALEEVVRSCQNPRLKALAGMRLADTQWLLGETGAEANYEKVIQQSDTMIDRFFPFALYNVGEIKYRHRDFPRARFYFLEFLKYEDKDGPCVPHALKRMADIAFQSGENWEKVAGLYLAVHDRAPLTDVGRFSYIHALLLGLKNLPKVEYKRRMKVIDAEIDQIKDEAFRELAYLEKGLALLDAGERSAVDYLVRLNERTAFNLEEGAIAVFVRQRLLEILESEVEKQVKGDPHLEEADSDVFGPLEQAFPVWMEGSPYEATARRFYYRMLLSRFQQALNDGNPADAIAVLDRWVQSPAWMEKALTAAMRQEVGGRLLRTLVNAPARESDKLALVYLQHEASLRPFVDGDYGMVWAAAALATGDRARLKAMMEAKPPERKLASPNPSLPKDDLAYLDLVWGETLSELERTAEADRFLQKVKAPALIDKSLAARLALYGRTKEYGKAFEMARQIFTRSSPAEKRAQLDGLQDLIRLGKLWDRTGQVLGFSQKLGVKGKDLAPFYYLAGRGSFELNRCKSAVDDYEAGLKLDPDRSESAEARFRLGKCLLKEKKTAAARKIWEELIGQKDAFWSPLAQNELQILK